jgi:hypothetical protein
VNDDKDAGNPGTTSKMDINLHGDPQAAARSFWDPNGPKTPSLIGIITNTTGLGVIVILFAMNYVQQSGRDERVIEKIQAGLDKQEDRRMKEQERELARTDKMHEANETRLRDWAKASAERQVLEGDKVRLELKAMTEQMKTLSEQAKLLIDRVRLSTMKDPE